jgi:Na+-transporting NADH:ubiquinone oxidoreductase subunit NqrB
MRQIVQAAPAGRRAPAIDARSFQVATLGTLLFIQVASFDLGTSPAQIAVTVVSTLVTQAAFCRGLGITFDWRSPLITALSLSLLLRSHAPIMWAGAGALAIASKFLIRINGKHVFNPSCFGIVALLLTSNLVWVSPGIWGSSLWLGVFLVSCGGLVLTRSSRIDVSMAFFVFYGGLLLARCLALGDPPAIPLHQIQLGALLLFGLFMITDPPTTPDNRTGRILFAAFVALLGYWLQFSLQIRTGLFYALIIASFLTPVLDRLFLADRFRWTKVSEA